jgi:hypothetical protein
MTVCLNARRKKPLGHYCGNEKRETQIRGENEDEDEAWRHSFLEGETERTIGP